MAGSYLKIEAMQARQAMAAYFLRDCDSVLDIGAGDAPITGLLAPYVVVIAIDAKDVPPMPAGEWPCAIHRKQTIRHGTEFSAAEGVCLLGHPGGMHLPRAPMIRAVKACRVAVLECARYYGSAMEEVAAIAAHSGKGISARLWLEVHAPGIVPHHPYRAREMIVLK